MAKKAFLLPISSIFLVFSLVLCSLFLTGCFSPYSGEASAETATITINLGGGPARSAGWDGEVGTSDLILTHVITLTPVSGNGTLTTINVGANQTQVVNHPVTPGIYDIEVEAFVNGWDYGIEIGRASCRERV